MAIFVRAYWQGKQFNDRYARPGEKHPRPCFLHQLDRLWSRSPRLVERWSAAQRPAVQPPHRAMQDLLRQRTIGTCKKSRSNALRRRGQLQPRVRPVQQWSCYGHLRAKRTRVSVTTAKRAGSWSPQSLINRRIVSILLAVRWSSTRKRTMPLCGRRSRYTFSPKSLSFVTRIQSSLNAFWIIQSS